MENDKFVFGAGQPVPYIFGDAGSDTLSFDSYVTGDSLWMSSEPDMVNSPAHYTVGRTEAIDIIEDAIAEAPNVQAGYLQGQALKYLLRLWHKIDGKEDAEKARWYLNRLIDSL